MTEERRSVLNLVAEGKITVDEAERLLKALDDASDSDGGPSAGESAKPKPRYLQVCVKKKGAWSDAAVDEARKVWGWPGFVGTRGDKEVNIRVPLAIVRSGLRLGAMIPGIAGRHARLRERGIDVDLSKLDPETIESLLDELGELNIDIDSGRAEVRITSA